MSLFPKYINFGVTITYFVTVYVRLKVPFPISSHILMSVFKVIIASLKSDSNVTAVINISDIQLLGV